MVFAQVLFLYECHFQTKELIALLKLFLDNIMVFLQTLLKLIQVNLFLFYERLRSHNTTIATAQDIQLTVAEGHV